MKNYDIVIVGEVRQALQQQSQRSGTGSKVS